MENENYDLSLEQRLNMLEIHRQSDSKALSQVASRLDKGSEAMDSIRADLADNTNKTVQVLDYLATAEKGLKVLGWIGGGAKWIGYIAAALSAVWILAYQATHGGKLPG